MFLHVYARASGLRCKKRERKRNKNVSWWLSQSHTHTIVIYHTNGGKIIFKFFKKFAFPFTSFSIVKKLKYSGGVLSARRKYFQTEIFFLILFIALKTRKNKLIYKKAPRLIEQIITTLVIDFLTRSTV